MSYRATELLVLRWAEARGIIQNGNSQTQLLKTMSELGELADAIAKRDKLGIVDGLGDVLVTLIVVADLEGLDLTTCLKAAYEEIKDRKGYLNEKGIFIKET